MLGRPSYAESGEVVAEAARVLARALPKATFLPALRRGNVFGALDMGLAPGLLPGPGQPRAGRELVRRRLGRRARGRPGSIRPASSPPWPARPRPGPAEAGVRALILLGADPLSDFPDRAVAEQALSAGHFIVAVTGHPSESVDAYADVVLPLRRGPRTPGHDDQHRRAGEPAGPEADRPRVRLAGLDDRGRAGRCPRGRISGSAAPTTWPTSCT